MRPSLGVLGLVGVLGCGGAVADDDGDADDAGRSDDAGATDDAPVVHCEPTAGEPLWIEEGETASATIRCATGEDPGGEGFAVGALPDGATYDAATATLSFTPGLDQAAVHVIALEAPAFGETGELTIGVADRFDDDDNVPVVDPAAYPAEMGLPTFFVSPTPTSHEVYEPVTVVYGGRSYQVQGKLRGASSSSYPKKSLTLDFSGDKLTAPELGLVDEKKIVLTTFDDNSYLRAKLVWELWSRLMPTVPVAAAPAVLYLDGEYRGLYVVSDHVDDELMGSYGLPEAGNLYKAVSHDANFMLFRSGGGDKTSLLEGYVKKHGLPADDHADLDALVTFVATANDATFAIELDDRIDVADFQAWWLLAVFTRADDSAGKNSYLHKSTETPWHVVPWDFNNSFGQSWDTNRVDPTPIDTYDGRNHIFGRMLAHAELAPPLVARFAAELGTGGAFELAWVQARIDALAAELAPSALRDERRWRDTYLTYGGWQWSRDGADDWTTFAEEVAYVKQWVDARWTALDAAYSE